MNRTPLASSKINDSDAISVELVQPTADDEPATVLITLAPPPHHCRPGAVPRRGSRARPAVLRSPRRASPRQEQAIPVTDHPLPIEIANQPRPRPDPTSLTQKNGEPE
jgi:hypothetical protein